MDESKELKKIKKECQAMIKMLKHLQEQEISLKSQNKILAREALNLGYRDSLGDGNDDDFDGDANGDGDGDVSPTTAKVSTISSKSDDAPASSSTGK